MPEDLDVYYNDQLENPVNYLSDAEIKSLVEDFETLTNPNWPESIWDDSPEWEELLKKE